MTLTAEWFGVAMASSMVKPSARQRPLMQRSFSKPSSKPLISWWAPVRSTSKPVSNARGGGWLNRTQCRNRSLERRTAGGCWTGQPVHQGECFQGAIPRGIHQEVQPSGQALWNGGGSAERSNCRAWQPDAVRPRTSHFHRHNRKTTPRPWNLGRRVMAYTFGKGNGTQRQQNNIPIQERNGHRGWGWINPAFFVWVEKFIFMWYNLFDK